MTQRDAWLDAVRQVVGDKPLFLLVGATDLVGEKLRELPEALTSLQEESRDFPMRAASVLVGQAFRANLKVGELYDGLTRRGEHVVARMQGEPDYAEEDEPFVREPYLPEPVRPAPLAEEPVAPRVRAPAPPAKKAAKKAAPAAKASAKATKKAATKATKKPGPVKKPAAQKKTGPDRR